MFPFTHDYTVHVGDVRKANYFGTVRRSNRAFLIMALFIGGAVIYALSAVAVHAEPNSLIFFIAGAYAVWGILQIAGAEKNVRNSVQSKNSPIGKPSSVSFTTDELRIRIPACHVDRSFSIKRLAVVFELASEYLIYVDIKQVYIIPKRGLSEERQQALRSLFRTRLGDRFWTRFEKKK